jgi:DNA-binding Xre family transcriptional regulator
MVGALNHFGGNTMQKTELKISFRPLWKLLIDRKISKSELRKRTHIAASTFTKMNNDQMVSLDVLARICYELGCTFDDVVELESRKTDI